MDGALFHHSSFPEGLFAKTTRVQTWFYFSFEHANDPLPVVVLPKRFTVENPNYPVRSRLPTKVGSINVASIKHVSYTPVIKYLPERKPKFL